MAHISSQTEKDRYSHLCCLTRLPSLCISSRSCKIKWRGIMNKQACANERKKKKLTLFPITVHHVKYGNFT